MPGAYSCQKARRHIDQRVGILPESHQGPQENSQRKTDYYGHERKDRIDFYMFFGWMLALYGL